MQSHFVLPMSILVSNKIKNAKQTINILLRLSIFTFLVGVGLSSHANHSNFKYFDIDDGLPQSTVSDIAQDKDGYVWLATQQGIARFDGYEFISYKHNEDPQLGLPASYSNVITPNMQNGDIWIGTINGVTKYDYLTKQFEPGSIEGIDSKPNKFITSIIIDNNENIWLGTEFSLYVKTPNSDTFAEVQTNLAPFSVSQIYAGSNSTIYIATDKGLLAYNTNDNAFDPPALEGVDITSLASLASSDETLNHRLWIGTKTQGIIEYDTLNNQRIKTLASAQGLKNAHITSLAFDGAQNLWIGSYSGLEQYNINTQALSSLTNDDNNASVVSITNISDSIFFGSLNRGFSIIDTTPHKFTRIPMPQPQPNYGVTSDKDNKIWISGQLGVYRFDPLTEAVEGPLQKRSSDNGQSTAVNTTDIIVSTVTDEAWVGTRVGLFQVDKSDMTLREASILANTFVYSLEEDSQGYLWIGTRTDGTYRINPVNSEILEHWDIPLSLSIFYESEDSIWVATTGGLYRLNSQNRTFELFKNDPQDPLSLSFDVVTWVSKLNDNDYFVGTQSKGLQRMSFTAEGARFTQLFESSPLAETSIGAVVQDQNGVYWITTTEGIVRVSNDLSSTIYFSEKDGVDNSGYFIGANTKDQQGNLYFSGGNGTTIFNPEEVLVKDKMPTIKFTEVRQITQKQQQLMSVNLSQIESGDLVLSPEVIAIEFNFAAIDFINPQSIDYKYKLEGFHTTWQYADAKNRKVTFTNLAPGEYTLHVGSTNEYKIWNPESISLRLTVKPPWWQSNLALMLWLTLAVLFIYLLFRWRTYSLLLQSKRLTRMVEEKTRDLEQANQQLRYLSNSDSLTKLLNRRGFKEHAVNAFSRFKRLKENFSLIIIDVDFFKKVNDKHGHDIGDQILVDIADLFQNNIRTHDLIARWGGEEFIVLLPSTTIDEAYNVAEKLRICVQEKDFGISSKDSSKTQTITISAGLSDIQSTLDIDACISAADKKLYQAKEAGRNQVCL